MLKLNEELVTSFNNTTLMPRLISVIKAVSHQWLQGEMENLTIYLSALLNLPQSPSMTPVSNQGWDTQGGGGWEYSENKQLFYQFRGPNIEE